MFRDFGVAPDKLRRLFDCSAAVRRCRMAKNAANATVRLGHGGNHRGALDWKPPLARARLLLGNRRNLAGLDYAKSAIWVSRSSIHQLLRRAFRNYNRHYLPYADLRISTPSDGNLPHDRVD